MTAVEFIFEELENRENCSPHFTIEQIYNKAKEMEKQQIIDAYVEGSISLTSKTEAEQYYNETFKQI